MGSLRTLQSEAHKDTVRLLTPTVFKENFTFSSTDFVLGPDKGGHVVKSRYMIWHRNTIPGSFSIKITDCREKKVKYILTDSKGELWGKTPDGLWLVYCKGKVWYEDRRIELSFDTELDIHLHDRVDLSYSVEGRT